MPEGYWGDAVNPAEDDFDEWIKLPEEEVQDEGDEIDEEEFEDAFDALDQIMEQIGPDCVLEAVSGFLYECDRPYHRIARQITKLAERIRRAHGAVEEGRQTRGYR